MESGNDYTIFSLQNLFGTLKCKNIWMARVSNDPTPQNASLQELQTLEVNRVWSSRLTLSSRYTYCLLSTNYTSSLPLCPSFPPGASFGPGGPGQGQWNANPRRSLPQGSLRHLRDPLLAQDQTGVCYYSDTHFMLCVRLVVSFPNRLSLPPPPYRASYFGRWWGGFRPCWKSRRKNLRRYDAALWILAVLIVF